VNVLKLPILILSALILSGCAGVIPKNTTLDVQVQEVSKPTLSLDQPKPLEISPPQWIIITPQNAEEVRKTLLNSNQPVVLIGLTSKEYENFSYSLLEIRNFISLQRQIIIEYQNYYEPKK
jgi:hypothetical protein